MSFFSDQSGGGEPAASLKLAAIGAGFWGTIESISLVDQKKYNSDEVVKDAAGNNVKQLRVMVKGNPDNYATASKALTDESGAPQPDEGRRAVYVARNTNLSFRIAEALQEAGGQPLLDKGLEVGGMISIQYIEDIPTTKGNPARGHAVKYKAPAPTSGDFFGGSQAPAPVAAAPVAAAPAPNFQQQVQQAGAAYQAPAPVAAPPVQAPTQAPPASTPPPF